MGGGITWLIAQFAVIYLDPGRHTVACPKRQTSVLNGKSSFLSCFPTNVDEICRDDRSRRDLTPTKFHQVWLENSQVDLPFRTTLCPPLLSVNKNDISLSGGSEQTLDVRVWSVRERATKQ